MLKISLFYLDKQKRFIPKNYEVWIVIFQPKDAVLSCNSPGIYGTEVSYIHKKCFGIHMINKHVIEMIYCTASYCSLHLVALKLIMP